jgi:hypothetical protein
MARAAGRGTHSLRPEARSYMEWLPRFLTVTLRPWPGFSVPGLALTKR